MCRINVNVHIWWYARVILSTLSYVPNYNGQFSVLSVGLVKANEWRVGEAHRMTLYIHTCISTHTRIFMVIYNFVETMYMYINYNYVRVCSCMSCICLYICKYTVQSNIISHTIFDIQFCR